MARKVDTEDFVKRAKIIHGNKYDYSKVMYTKMDKNVTIICPLHGEFSQVARNHLQGRGCPLCARNKRKRKVYGVGIYDMTNCDKNSLNSWRRMLFRCYNDTYNKSYKGCEVCNEWKLLSNFSKWYNDNCIEGWHLDKDILGNGKLYSPETCCFVPIEINSTITTGNKDGVTFANGKWQSACGKKYIGRYESKSAAIRAYKEYKQKRVTQVADKYKSLLPIKVYNALINLFC